MATSVAIGSAPMKRRPPDFEEQARQSAREEDSCKWLKRQLSLRGFWNSPAWQLDPSIRTKVRQGLQGNSGRWPELRSG